MSTRSRKFLPRDAKRKKEAPSRPSPARKRRPGDSYFCDICLATMELRRPITRKYTSFVKMRHHQDLSSLELAAKEECWFCYRIYWPHDNDTPFSLLVILESSSESVEVTFVDSSSMTIAEFSMEPERELGRLSEFGKRKYDRT